MIKVIGIDPAPSKESTVFDGNNFFPFSYIKLKGCLKKIKKENTENKMLICWDAPLSFSIDCSSPFTKRDIEKFFSQKEGEETPKGISVMGYSTCPHWIITQNLLGYPQTNECNFNHPYQLVFNQKDITLSITEVHPAVAIWLWCREENHGLTNWNYKGKKEENEKIIDCLIEILKSKSIIDDEVIKLIKEKPRKKQDDYLDAYIAWKLGQEWVTSNQNVMILGDSNTGSFLLPYSEKLFVKFNNYKFK